MFKITWNGKALAATYATKRAVRRGIHELIEEALGFDGNPDVYIDAINEYGVIRVDGSNR